MLASDPVDEELLCCATGTTLCSALDLLALSGSTEVWAELGTDDDDELAAVELAAVDVVALDELALELLALEVLGGVEVCAVELGATEVSTGDGQVVVGKNLPCGALPVTFTSTWTKHLPSAACSNGKLTSLPKDAPMSRSLFHW